MLRKASRARIIALTGLLALGITTAHSLFVGIPAESAQAVILPECSDGLDNDVDGETDFPEDLDCDSPSDQREGDIKRDLFVTVSDGMDEVEPGESLSYTVSLRIDDDEPRTMNVRFFLPGFVNMMTASENGSKEGNIVVWRDVVVFPDFVKNLYVTLEVQPSTPDGTLLLSEAVADGEKATDTTRVVEEEDYGMAPLEIFVNDGKIYAEPGEELHYTITVKNTFAPARSYKLITHLPSYLHFLDATGGYKRDHRSVEWHDQFIDAGEIVVYDLFAYIERDAPEFATIRLKAASAAAIGSDTTTVLYEQLPPAALGVSVTDGHESVRPGGMLTYTIEIHNNRGKLLTGIDVTNAQPVYTEFVSATEGGYWTGKDVHWTDLTVSPHGYRRLQVTLRVRSDAPLGAELRNRVNAAGHEAVDLTHVSNVTSGSNSNNYYSNNQILRKVADRLEVRPGDTISYTIVVNNTLDHPFRNVRVEDRLDLTYCTILNAQSGNMTGDRIVWEIPVLDPGQHWSVNYTVRVKESAPHGIEIANVATVSGDGMETLSLTDTTRTTRIGVVTYLPKSGAPLLDVLFAAISLLLSSVPTIWIRRRCLV